MLWKLLIKCWLLFVFSIFNQASAEISSTSVGLTLGGTSKTGDLEAIVERRTLRVLTVYGPGRYYLDEGAKGVTAEYAKRLGTVINETFDTGHLKIMVVVIPVARDELFQALVEGRGDVVIAGTTITEARQENVDFTNPVSKPLKEIVVTGPSGQGLRTLADFSGKTVYLRPSSSYADSVYHLNERFAARNQAAIAIEPMSELLEDEDLIEMVNAGLLPWAIVDSYKPIMWKNVFTQLTVGMTLFSERGLSSPGQCAGIIHSLRTFLTIS
jgi:membrane-bound lytic murein transglycosylase MltF